MKKKIQIDTKHPPRVLFLGNGVLLLSKGTSWSDLLSSIKLPGREMPDVKDIPFAMQPEAIRGTDVEEVQRLIAANIDSQIPHAVLKELVFMDFDAIITTNYTYEIEDALLGGKWTDSKRKSSRVWKLLNEMFINGMWRKRSSYCR